MLPEVTVLDSLEAMLEGPDSRKLRVGLALPMSGVLGMAGPSALESLMLAGQEINASRTSSERAVEFVVVDSGGPSHGVAQTILDLSRSGVVEAIIGLHTSHTMETIERALVRQEMPYVFTAGHEGVQRVPGLYCPGESPMQFASGLTRVMHNRQVRDWAIVGTDYVWPRAMREAARRIIESQAGRVVLDRLIPQGGVDAALDGFLRDLITCGAGGVIINLPGRDLTTVLLAIRARGLDRMIVQISGGLEENGLYAVGGDSSGNLYSTQHSFESSPSDRRQELNNRYRFTFGDASPVLNAWAEHCYDSAHLIDQLDRCDLLTPASLGAIEDAGTPREAVKLRPKYDIHLAVAEGMSFAVL